MKDLNEIKQTLRNALPREGISFVIKSLKDLLPADSPKYDLLIALEADYRQLKLDSFEGILDKEEENRIAAQLRRRVLEFLQSLEAEDFDRRTRRSRLAPEQKIQRGHVLYRIPKQMQLGKETRCLVRIAFDKAMIVEDLDLDENTELRSQVRISDYMKVELTDPGSQEVFAIRSTSETVQFIDADDFTEWKFYVQPLQPGEHVLELKVTVMLRINGEDRVREKTLEESVVIVTEAPAEAEAKLPFRTFDEDIVLPCPLETVAPRRVGRIPAGLRLAAIGLALLAGLSSGVYAFNPAFREQVDWLNTRYVQNDAEAYEGFIEKHPESPRRETATFKKAEALDREGKETAAVAAYLAYKQTYQAGKYLEDALWNIAAITQAPEDYQTYLAQADEPERAAEAEQAIRKLETKVWEAASTQPSPVTLDRYLRLYPQGKHRTAAIERLADSTTWRQPATPQLPPRLLADTADIKERLLRYAGESDQPQVKTALEKRVAEAEKTGFFAPKPATETTERAPADDKQKEASPTPPDTPKPASDTAASGAKPAVDPPTTTSPEPAVDQPRDADGDGVTDPEDDCPTEAGPATLQGCPDTDQDGIADKQDQCPTVAGAPEYRGCPPPEPAPNGKIPLPEMVRIPGGTFTMGCLNEERDGDCINAEKPAHPVTVPAFYLSRYEVTNAQFAAFLNEEGNREEGGTKWYDIGSTYAKIREVDGRFEVEAAGFEQHPVVAVSWYGARAYAAWLSKKTGQNYRLPTEAEWEYAARGGEKGALDHFLYAGSDKPDAVAWHDGNSGGGTHPVGQLQPNQLGLYDMSGNVYEWCADDWHGNYDGAPTDGSAWKSGGDSSRRVLRGGSWFNVAGYARVAFRNRNYSFNRHYYFGFRLARD